MIKLSTISVAIAMMSVALACNVANASAPKCSYENITNDTLDVYVANMWGQRTLKSQNTLIDCLDIQWRHHVDPAKNIKNAEFEKHASPAMLSAMQFDVVNFVAQVNGKPILLQSWLKTLQFGSFTWEVGGTCDYERQRKTLIIMLKANRASLKSYAAYGAIMDSLNAITCKAID